jgi:hypothetical protein
LGAEWFTPTTVLIVIAVVLIRARLERLGKQIEAVKVSIISECAPTQEQRNDVVRDWQQNRKEERKAARQFWIFWGIIGAALLAYYLLRG